MSISDLSKANDLLDKLGETFKDFESHSLSILTLSDQWLILQNSLVEVHNSLEHRVNEVESKEREFEVTKRRLKDMEMRYKEFEFHERSMEERLKEVNMKEKQVKELCEGLELEKSVIEERSKAVESREKRIAETEFEKLRVLKVREEEVSNREERCWLREEEVEKTVNSVELRVKLIDQREEDVEVKEKKLSEFSEELKSKEGMLSERLLALEQKEEEFEKKKEDLESKGKEMDELYNVIMLKEKEVNEGREKFVAQEKRLRSSLEEVNGLMKGIEMKDRGIAERWEELEAKEKEYQDRVKKMESKEKAFNMRWGSVETREKDVQEKFQALRVEENRIKEKTKALDLREEELNKKYQMVELKEKQVDDQQHGFELQKKEIIELCEKIGLKGKQVNEGQKALELKEKQIDKHCKDAILKEKDIDKRSQAMEMKGRHVNIEKGHEALELKETQIEERSEVIETKEKEVMEFSEAVELNKKEVGKGNEALKLKEMQIDERCKRLEPKEKELNEQCQALETKEKHIANDGKALDFTEEQMNEKLIGDSCLVEEFAEKQIDGCNILVRCESKKQKDAQIVDSNLTQVSQDIPQSDIPQSACIDHNSSKLRGEIHLLCKNMDPNGLSSYLIEHVKELNLKNEELLDALRSSPNPAKLVLDVSQNFHQKFPCSKQTKASKNSCIFLLEQLMKLSPPIPLDVKDKAKDFATLWKDKLKVVFATFWKDKPKAGDVRDTYGFLQFLAAFKLASLFDAKELLSLFDIFYLQNEVYRRDDNQYLCCVLGLSKEIPGMIECHIRRENWLLALKYVCVFKLQSNFPPVPLLEAHMASITRRVNDRQKDGTLTPKSQASYLELTKLEEVVKCVTSFKLEHVFPIDSLVARIKTLEEFKENRKFFALTQMKKKMKKRNASSCTDQQDKRPRVGPHDHNTHQFPQPLQHHAIHMTPNFHPNFRQGNVFASNGPSYNTFNPHLLSGQFVPPGNHPFGAPMPVYYGVKAEMGPGGPPGSSMWPIVPGVGPLTDLR